MKGSKGFKRTRNILLSALAAATLLTGSALPAFAADTDTTTTTTKTVSFNKVYTLTMPTGGIATDYASPAETFSFTSGKSDATTTTPGEASLAALKGTSWNTNRTDVQDISALDDPAVTEASNIPQKVTVSSAAFTDVAATADGATAAVNVTTTGSYTKPGVYYYDFHEVAGATAGVTYDSTNYRVAVTVENKNGSMVPSTVKLINLTSGDKVEKITNKYEAGKLSFTKKVAGNLGDTSKQFKVTVTLTAPANKIVKSTIGVTGTIVTTEPTTIAPADWTTDGTVSKTFTVQDGTTISLTNIPQGVRCLVKEADYSAAGYTTTYTLNNGGTTGTADASTAQNMVAGGTIGVTITNTNDTTIDTGIFTTNLPYILILAVAIAGAVAFVVVSRKRRA
ncbi:MAG: Spy0128 family protein [Bilifractor sp.]